MKMRYLEHILCYTGKIIVLFGFETSRSDAEPIMVYSGTRIQMRSDRTAEGAHCYSRTKSLLICVHKICCLERLPLHGQASFSQM